VIAELKSKEYGGLDRFRLVAALLIVGIHTYPLYSVSEELDFVLMHILARIAVPFFLVVTGYFLPLDKMPSGFLKKTGLLYAGATLLYLPISIYAGYYSEGNIFAVILRNIVFDGTFYHLWYLPALIIGVLIIYLLSRRLSIRVILVITGFLYLLGLLGDSYYGITADVPFLNATYDSMFHVFSYTRNGLFYAPIFLAMGVSAAQSKNSMSAGAALTGFFISMLVMLTEGLMLHYSGIPRHDSMYISLIPSMYFLFQFLLTRKGEATPLIRGVSMWIYILHPLFIILIRGAAKVTGFSALFIDYSIFRYIAVCLSTGIAAILITKLQQRKKTNGLKIDRTYESACDRAWIELDFDALRHNINLLQSFLPDGCTLMPAVKSNAYGHGAVPIARDLNTCGIYDFCVATVWEGVELRKNNIKGEILILGYTHPDLFNLLRRYSLTQTVVDYMYAGLLNEFNKKLAVHIKIDTGMRRFGERSENIDNIIRIFNYGNLIITGIYTHLCVADSDNEADDNFSRLQTTRFNEVLLSLKEQGVKLPAAHVHSSYGVLRNLENPYDCTRVGISLYGMLSNKEDSEKWGTGLQPVLSLKARVGSVKTLYEGEPAGYGLTFTASRDMRIAIITIGYADGLPRELSCGNGFVLINGKKAPIIGRVCMDSITVDITDIENVKSGDIAILIGKTDDFEITACDIAKMTNTISNEILSRLGARLNRVVKD